MPMQSKQLRQSLRWSGVAPPNLPHVRADKPSRAKTYPSQRYFELDFPRTRWQSDPAGHLLDVLLGANSEVPS
jgi:hypothetical protein